MNTRWCSRYITSLLFLSGLDSLCAPFLYLNFNNEGENLYFIFLNWFLKFLSVISCCFFSSPQLWHTHACLPSSPNTCTIFSWRTTLMSSKVRDPAVCERVTQHWYLLSAPFCIYFWPARLICFWLLFPFSGNWYHKSFDILSDKQRLSHMRNRIHWWKYAYFLSLCLHKF